MRFFRRALVGLFLLAVTVSLLAVAGNTVWTSVQTRMAEEGRSPPARERVFTAEVVTVTPGLETPILTAFGEVRARRTLELRAPVEGTVIELAEGFEDGGAVREGQLLMRLDPAEAQSARDTAAADLRDAENEVTDATAALALAEEDVAAARVQADLRQRALERQQDLFARGVGSAVAVEEAELSAATANQAVLSRRQALASAEARLAAAETALDRRRIALAEADRQLARTELRAEFDGVLSEVDVVAGRLVNRNEQIGRLIDPDALEVAFRISTAQYTQLIGDAGTVPETPVSVVLDVFGVDVTTPATLSRESGSVGAGQSGRLLFARIDDPGALRVGDFVRVDVEEPQIGGVARIPATALGSDGQVLLVGEEDRLAAVPVTLVRRQGDEVLVRTPPWMSGQEIVATRTPVLGAGIRVEPLRLPADGSAPVIEEPQTIVLDPERRARLIAFVSDNSFIPSDVKDRMIEQLNAEEVPAAMVARIEDRMGS